MKPLKQTRLFRSKGVKRSSNKLASADFFTRKGKVTQWYTARKISARDLFWSWHFYFSIFDWKQQTYQQRSPFIWQASKMNRALGNALGDPLNPKGGGQGPDPS